jgi:hypothetical protein
LVEDSNEFVRWALKWGAEAEVVGPPQVRAAAAALARDIVARYEGPLPSRKAPGAS